MINFSINKTFFLHALQIAKKAISSKNAIPILSTLKLDVKSDEIILTASNGQISIETFLSSQNENAGLLINETGSILLEANFFINVVSSLPESTLDIEEIENYQILLKSGKSLITLKGKDTDFYPHLQDIKTTNSLSLSTKVLKSLISETAFAASLQESRPILTGVHMLLNDKKEFKAIATDSHRMSQRQIILENSQTEFDVVIPSKSLRELSSILTDDIETIEVYFSASQMLFKTESISFYTRLLEGNYPDTDRLLTNHFETEVTFNTTVLKHAMERAHLISNATQNGTVKLEMLTNKVTAYVNSPEVGKVNEEIDTIHQSGNDLTISFNPTYLIEALKAFNSETVTIRFISSVRPFTLTPEDDKENFIQLITPVRTN